MYLPLYIYRLPSQLTLVYAAVRTGQLVIGRSHVGTCPSSELIGSLVIGWSHVRTGAASASTVLMGRLVVGCSHVRTSDPVAVWELIGWLVIGCSHVRTSDPVTVWEATCSVAMSVTVGCRVERSLMTLLVVAYGLWEVE